jgi:maltooligosyltrehalose trehalohydrolase
MLFEGEEWAASTPFNYFTDHDDPELAHAITTGRRREFAALALASEEIPDPQAADTFARSVLRWTELGGGDHAVALGWYRTLIAIRKVLPDLGDDSFAHIDATAHDDVLVMQRGAVTVVVNFGDSPQSVDAAGVEVLATLGEAARTGGGVVVGGESAVVMRR